MSERRYQLWLRLIFDTQGHVTTMGRATCSYILLDTHNAEQCERFAEELRIYDYWLQAEGPTPTVRALIGCRNGVPNTPKKQQNGSFFKKSPGPAPGEQRF